MNKMWFRSSWKWLPALAIFGVFLVFYRALDNEHRFNHQQEWVSFPEFNLMDIKENQPITLEKLKGKVYVAHVWASWCSPCKKEHLAWLAIKEKLGIPLVGILYRDKATEALAFTKKAGDPFYYLLNDNAGKLGLDLGIIGTPETFVVDKEGTIQFHHVGTLSQKQLEEEILPLVAQLQLTKN